MENSLNNNTLSKKHLNELQECPSCGYLIGVVAGSKDAICTNCGFKDPCCE